MKKIIVFSLDQKNKVVSPEDISALEGIFYQSNLIARRALGLYKGELEKSFIVEIDQDIQVDLIRAIARAYNQESILSVDAKTKEVTQEFLLDENKVKKQILGHWVKTDKINPNGMTLDLKTMKAYEVK